MPPRLIHSDMDRSYGHLECEWCSNDAAGNDDYQNYHTLYNDLRSFRPGGTDRALNDLIADALAVIEANAQAQVAETTDQELICWCGHSLHYHDCPDDGDCHIDDSAATGTCRDRYRATLN